MEFLDLSAQYKTIKKEINLAIRRLLENAEFIGGKEVEEFEKDIAKLCRAKYAIALNSGTDALFLSLKALGIGPGCEVITPSFTFIATVEVIANLGAKPVFVDIKSDTFNINPELIERSLTSRTKAIIPVHLFGQMADMGKIMEISRRNKLKVIEDAAQAIGATIRFHVSGSRFRVQKAASIGDIGCLSFFPSKNLGAYGDGGMVVTNNKKLADKIRLLRSHGSSPREKYLHLALGMNSRLDSIQAAILRVKLRYLKSWTKKRQEIARFYNQKLTCVGDIITPETLPGRAHIFHQYTIRTKYRDKLKKYLKENGIPTKIYYPLPLHLQPALKYLGYRKGDFLITEEIAKQVLSLPIYPELKNKNQKYLVRKIKNFYGNKKLLSK